MDKVMVIRDRNRKYLKQRFKIFLTALFKNYVKEYHEQSAEVYLGEET